MKVLLAVFAAALVVCQGQRIRGTLGLGLRIPFLSDSKYVSRPIVRTNVIAPVINQLPSYQSFVQDEWNLFKNELKKGYADDTVEAFRMKIFMENKHFVSNHNEKYMKGLVLNKLEMNNFGDLFLQEFVTLFNGFNRTGVFLTDDAKKPVAAKFIPPAHVQLPESVDWRKVGAVTPVKYQMGCGCCWAFSATGALEGQLFRVNHTLVSLSEQHLIDCSGEFGNMGCEGGLVDFAYEYVKANMGINTEDSYPFEAQNGTCRFNPHNIGATDVGFVELPRGDENALKAAVATIGPISVGIDADHRSFMLHKEGIYYEPECSSENLSHAMLVVGYGTDDSGTDYWLVKNSYGEDWGEEGYFKMIRNENNHCGIATTATYPLV